MTEPSPNGAAQRAPARRIDVRHAVRERKLLVLGAPIALVALTLAFVLVMRPVYESATSIRIDEERSGVAMLEMVSALARGSEVFTEMAVLQSRAVAEDVVRSLDLQLAVDAPRRTLRSALLVELRVDTAAPEATYLLERSAPHRYRLTGEIVHPRDQPGPFERPAREWRDYGEVGLGEEARLEGVTFRLAPGVGDHDVVALSVVRFQDAVRELQRRIDVSRPDREADVVVVRHRGNDPELVRAVPNELAAHFLARRQQAQSAEARSTAEFLAQQIDTLDEQLMAAEETLRGFSEQHRIVSVEAEADAQVQRLAGLQARRDLLVAEREALGSLLEEVRAELPVEGVSPYRRLMSFPTLIQNSATTEMLAQLVTLENQRAELMMTRTAVDRDVRILDERIDALEMQLRTMAETYWRGIGEQVASLGAGLAGFAEELARIPAQQMTYVRLGRQVSLLGDLYTLLQTKQKEAEIAVAVEDESVRVVDPALYPVVPVRPRPWLSLVVALLLGALVGVGGAVAAEHLDRTVRDRGELQAATGAAVLGLIPLIRPVTAGAGRLPWQENGDPARSRPRLVEPISGGHPAAEAYRSLRTNINFSRPNTPPKALVFTSPMPGDGKSTTAANMALVLSQQGGRVLLVDADMRRGALNAVFREPLEPGLSNVLVGAAALSDAIHRIGLPEGHALDFLASGTRPPNPAELLSSAAMAEFLRQANQRYDTVVFDAPPLNVVTDAALLGTHADGVLLVARAGVTEQEPLAYAVDQIERVRAPLLGTVLNGVDERRQGYYGSGGAAHGYFARG